MNDETMLPCPFCGNRDDFEGSPWPNGREAQPRSWIVRCGNPNCNAEVAGHTPDEAIALWNTRAQASAPEGENDRLREMAEHIAASSCPSDDSRLEIAYAIARHLKLDGWPCAYETASGEHIGVGVDVTEDGAWVSVRVGGKLMYSQLHNTFYNRSNAKAGEVERKAFAFDALVAAGHVTQADESLAIADQALSTHDKTKA